MTGGRIPTFVEGLDDNLEGGIPINTISLICGPTGSMKSSFAFNMLSGFVRTVKRPTLYLSLEQDREELIAHMIHLGIDYAAVQNQLYVIDLGTLREELDHQQTQYPELDQQGINWLHSIKKQLAQYKKMFGVEVLVFDSLEALYSLHPMQEPREELFHFIRHVKSLGITTLFISEMEQDASDFGKYGVEAFLADGIIHLTMREENLTVGRYIRVVKMRQTKHSSDYFPLVVDHRGLSVVTKG